MHFHLTAWEKGRSWPRDVGDAVRWTRVWTLLCKLLRSCLPVRPVQDASLCSRFGSGSVTSRLHKGAATSYYVYGHKWRINIWFGMRAGWRRHTKHFISNQQLIVTHSLMKLLNIPQGCVELRTPDHVVYFMVRIHFMRKESVFGICRMLKQN
jgi:hypothetical protein